MSGSEPQGHLGSTSRTFPDVRHAGRGEPMPIPKSERDIEDAVERHRREDEARHAQGAPIPWWKRLFAGRRFRLGR